MDGGVKQEEMAEQIKREVRENANRRRGQRAVHILDSRPVAKVSTNGVLRLPQEICYLDTDPDLHNNRIEPSPGPSLICPRVNEDLRKSLVLGQEDCLLVTFYLENLFTTLFPFYRPSFVYGGRAWIVEMMMSSPVVRQATLFQSSYFFHLAMGETNRDGIWEQTVQKTTEAFVVLRQALQAIDGRGIPDHPHGAARILASIMQIHRFEINISSFQNWQSHVNAALALFIQLITSTFHSGTPSSGFDAIMSRLGPSSSSSSSWGWPGHNNRIPSPDQAGFQFSSALVVFDDIIASVILQEQPKLYRYYRSLLSGIDGINKPLINLESVLGLKNDTLVQIGEIATLEAWKRQCSEAGNLDVTELVHRATAVKESLVAILMHLDTDSGTVPDADQSLLDAFNQPPTQGSLVTRVWTHAALIYLSTVVSGWQTACTDVRSNVSRILELLKCLTSPALLRTMAWPICVAGCLAEPAEETHFCRIIRTLKPPGVFGTVYMALKIMENAWRIRDADTATRSLTACFRHQGNLVLLV